MINIIIKWIDVQCDNNRNSYDIDYKYTKIILLLSIFL